MLNFQLLSQNPINYILGNKERVNIPIEYQNGFIVATIVLNDVVQIKCLVDTGAEVSLLFDKIYLDLLGLEADQKIKVMGADLQEELDAFVYRQLDVRFLKTKSKKLDIMVLEDDPLDIQQFLGGHIDGILGVGMFRGHILKIDYRKKILTIINPNFPPVDLVEYQTIPLTVESAKPYVSMTNNSGDKLKMLVDTGASISSLLYYENEEELPTKIVTGQLGKGIGGSIDGYVGIMHQLALDDLEISSLLVNYQKKDTLIHNRAVYNFRDGLLGNRFLEQFTVIIDFNRSILHLKKNKRFSSEAKYNMSGMIIIAFGNELNKFFVEHVLENSPAATAGVKKGDIICAVNHINYRFYTLESLYRLFSRKEGKRLNFSLERQGKQIKIPVTLSRYLDN